MHGEPNFRGRIKWDLCAESLINSHAPASIPREIASAIGEISPALNRELQEPEIYLSDKVFPSLQRLILIVIAGLTLALEKLCAPRHDLITSESLDRAYSPHAPVVLVQRNLAFSDNRRIYAPRATERSTAFPEPAAHHDTVNVCIPGKITMAAFPLD